MKSLLSFPIFVSLLLFAVPAWASQEIHEGDVVVAPLDGVVSSAQATFLRRALKDAEAAGASAFVIDMDTPGGELQAGVDILQMLLKARIPTYTWVNDDAGSAGALIALGSDHVYMAPVSAIGAAAPVMGTGQEIPETMNAKVVSYFSGYFRSAAEAKGRSPELAEAFIDKEKEFKIGDETISATGSLLTLSAQEAVKEYDGKPLLADGIAGSIDALKEEAGLSGATVVITPTGFERLALWITILAPLFLIGGIVAAYIEFKSPGFGVAGTLSIACFAIFFLGHYLAGLTGLESVAVFVIGLALIVTEVVFFPGVFFIAAAGIFLILGALLFAMADYFPGETAIPDASLLARPALNLAIAISVSILLISLLARYFPNLPLFRRLILAANNPAGPAFAKPTSYNPPVAVGDHGVAITILRPAGTGEFDGRPLDVVTDGEFLEARTRLVVRAVEGGRIIVAAAA